MESFPKGNHFYANKVIHLYLSAVEEVIGKNGLKASLNLAHLSHLGLSQKRVATLSAAKGLYTIK